METVARTSKEFWNLEEFVLKVSVSKRASRSKSHRFMLEGFGGSWGSLSALLKALEALLAPLGGSWASLGAPLGQCCDF